jgi:hypothetical protein
MRWRPTSGASAAPACRTYREEFLDELTDEMRDTFAARTAYLALRAS